MQGKFKLEEIRPGTSFREFAQLKYLPYARAHKKSWKRDELSLRHLVAFLGDKTLRQITNWDVESYKTKRKKNINPVTKKSIAGATVNRELACLKFLFNLAVKWGEVEHNPVKGVKFYAEQRRDRYLTEDEVQRLLSESSGKLRVIVLIGILTGMRLNEILSLQWKNVDLDRGYINIEAKDSKTREVRQIPITSMLTDELRNIRIVGCKFVFPARNRHHEHLKSIRSTFDKALRKVGIENCSFHTLRHTFASHHVMRGTDLLTLQKLGGWKSLSMVQRYSHLSKDHEKEAANRLADIFVKQSGKLVETSKYW